MLAIDNVLISDEIIEKKFVCDLSRCHGGCCVDGDAGAPLLEEELEKLETVYPTVKPYLTKAGIRAIERQGKYVFDDDCGYVTPVIDSGMCAYGVAEHGIVKCGIEKAFSEGKINFKKPVSCHLFPIRIEAHDGYDAMNYEPREHLCRPACELGGKLQVPVYRFLKEAITRKYGTHFYEALEAYHQMRQEGPEK